MRPFSEGLAGAEKGGKRGFVEKTGAWVINPVFEDTSEFIDGLAVVKKDGKYGVIDREANWIVKPRYRYLELIPPDDLSDYQNGGPGEKP